MTIEEMQKQIEAMIPTPKQIVESIDKKLKEKRVVIKLIDKDLLIKDIKERIKEITDAPHITFAMYGKREGYKDILSFLDTLEVKEVDLENLFQALPEYIADKKSHQIYRLSVYHYDGECVVDYVGELDHDSLYSFGGNTLHEAIEKAWNWLRENSNGG